MFEFHWWYTLLALIVLVALLRIIWLWRHDWIYLGYGFIAEHDETTRQVYIASRLQKSPAGRVIIPISEHNFITGIPIGAQIIEWDGISFEDLSEQECRERIEICAARHWRQQTTMRLRHPYSGTFTVILKSFLNTTSIPVYANPEHPSDPRYEHSVCYDSKIGSTYYIERRLPEGPPGCD